MVSSLDDTRGKRGTVVLTFFFICLYMASRASFIVTPFMLRAVTSMPRGKRISIFLTRGFVRGFLRVSFSSSVAGEVFSFLFGRERSRQYGVN